MIKKGWRKTKKIAKALSISNAQSIAFKQVGKYAWGKFTTASWTRENANLIPLMVTAAIIRSIVNWGLCYRLRTGNIYVDFCTGVIISVLTSIATPFFYAIAETKKHAFLSMTNNTLDHIFSIRPDASGLTGWDYFFNVRNKILITIGIIAIIALQFVQILITSLDIQLLIIHIGISSYIMGQYYQWQESIYAPKYVTPKKVYSGPRRYKIITLKPTYKTIEKTFSSIEEKPLSSIDNGNFIPIKSYYNVYDATYHNALNPLRAKIVKNVKKIIVVPEYEPTKTQTNIKFETPNYRKKKLSMIQRIARLL